jgi:hypothetical protein
MLRILLTFKAPEEKPLEETVNERVIEAEGTAFSSSSADYAIIQRSLISPGPSVVICDEGHTVRGKSQS